MRPPLQPCRERAAHRLGLSAIQKMWRFQIYGHLAKARGHRDGRFARRLLWDPRSIMLEESWQGSGSELGMPAWVTAFSACG